MQCEAYAPPPATAKTGFCGPEHLAPAWEPLVMEVVGAVRAAGRQILIGDAPQGLDALVRVAAPDAQVFPTELWSHASLVAAAAASGAGAALVGFATIACPAFLQPTTEAHTCFSQRVPAPIRQTWGPLAYAAGLKLPVLVFWCGDAAPWLPAWPGGAWFRRVHPDGGRRPGASPRRSKLPCSTTRQRRQVQGRRRQTHPAGTTPRWCGGAGGHTGSEDWHTACRRQCTAANAAPSPNVRRG